jgi:hypothetical protein
MKTLRIATVLALLAGSAAQAGSIIDSLFKESGVKIDDKSITVGDQKFNRSDVDSILNGLDKLMKDATKERADETNKSPSRRDDGASSQTDDHAAPRTVWRSDDHAAPRTDAQPSVSTPAKDNAVRASSRRSR